MKIILIGYMGAGKSAIGTNLASGLGLGFYDLDSEIARVEKRGVPEIFEQSGEIYFRKKEAEVLGQFLSSGPENFVLALGGGTPCYGKNLDLLLGSPDTVLIYLKTSLEELTQRLLKEKDQRPLIQHLGSEALLKDFVRKHLFERTYYYNQCHLVVDTDKKEIAEISREISELLK